MHVLQPPNLVRPVPRSPAPTRLETEPSRSLDGPSLWWSRRIRRALLVEALDDVATAAPITRLENAPQGAADAARGGGGGGGVHAQQPRLLWSAVEEWLEREIKGGPF